MNTNKVRDSARKRREKVRFIVYTFLQECAELTTVLRSKYSATRIDGILVAKYSTAITIWWQPTQALIKSLIF